MPIQPRPNAPTAGPDRPSITVCMTPPFAMIVVENQLLEIDALHLRLGITQARSGTNRNGIGDLRELAVRQVDRERSKIFEKPFFPLSAWDRHDVVALRQKPRQGELARRASFLARDIFDAMN